MRARPRGRESAPNGFSLVRQKDHPVSSMAEVLVRLEPDAAILAGTQPRFKEIVRFFRAICASNPHNPTRRVPNAFQRRIEHHAVGVGRTRAVKCFSKRALVLVTRFSELRNTVSDEALPLRTLTTDSSRTLERHRHGPPASSAWFVSSAPGAMPAARSLWKKTAAMQSPGMPRR